MKDYLLEDFSNPIFQEGFKKYFREMGYDAGIYEWDKVFDFINSECDNFSFMRLTDDDNIIGFIEFKIEIIKSDFFEEKCGFLREFWVAKEYRNQGNGAELLKKMENFLLEMRVYKTILTTNTAKDFYLKNGYIQDKSYRAVNNIDVFIKMLG